MDNKKALDQIIVSWFEMKNKEITMDEYLRKVEDVVTETSLKQAYEANFPCDLSGGNFSKFIVLKRDDIQKYTGGISKEVLKKTGDLISAGRESDGKNPYPSYIVINTDEPYIGEIVDILKRNGHWG